VLSQRTVGRFQRVLTALFNPVFYGLDAPLDSGSYYNLLYQEGVHPKLLDYLGNRYSFLPVPMTRALHEGEAVDSVGRYLDSNYALSLEIAREIGDIYLLVLAAVALRRYDELSYDQKAVYSNDVRGFLESLRQDGYRYQDGHVYDANGSTVALVPLTGGQVSRPHAARKDVQQPPPASPTRSVEAVTEVAGSNLGQGDRPTGKNWSQEAIIGFWSVLVTVVIGIATLIASVASPEVRRFLHLDKPSRAASETKPLNPALQTDKDASPPTGASPQTIPSTSPAEKTGVRDSVSVVVHRSSSQSGANSAMVATTGNGEQEINLGAAPTRLMFTPPGLAVDKRELPKDIKVSGQTLTVARYTNSGFVIDDHKHSDVHFTVYMVEAGPAKQ
jgi:hypothetical protein